MNFFGVDIFKKDKKEDKIPTIVTPVDDEASVSINSAGFWGTYVDTDASFKSEIELISRYRDIANYPDVDNAIEEITTESVSAVDEEKAVSISLDDLDFSDGIKKKISNEFDEILKLLEFKKKGHEIFKRWYVDGRLYYQKVIDPSKQKVGIQKLLYIDPRKIKKVREVKKEKLPSGVEVVKSIDEFFIYNDKGLSMNNFNSSQNTTGVRIKPDSIAFSSSGLYDHDKNMILSFLHVAIKPVNQLKMMTDAMIIYRLCLVGDTRVKTNTGWSYIKDLKENDVVYSYYGEEGIKETTIKKQWKTGTKQTYKVSSKHFDVTGSDNHPILVYDSRTFEVKYVDIKDIIPKIHYFVYGKPIQTTDMVLIPKPRNIAVKIINKECFSKSKKTEKVNVLIRNVSNQLDIKFSSVRNFLYGLQYLNIDQANSILEIVGIKDSVILKEKYEGFCSNQTYNVPEYVDEEFARLFGFMIGDGTVDKYRLTFSEGVHDDINEKYRSILDKYFGNCNRYPIRSRKYVNYTTSSALGADLFRKMGWIAGAKNKRIPEWLYGCSDSIKKEFILGLSDADGSERDSIYTGAWSSEIQLFNKQLVEDIKEVWTSIGLASGKIRYRCQEGGRVINGNNFTLPFTESWTIYISECELPRFEKIYTVEEAGIEDVYEIEVESEKHNFVANGIVVHNSRSPERRIFYIDTGNLPKNKAEEYMKSIMTKYRNKVVYDSSTGLVKDNRHMMTMMEDYFLPRRENGRGTQIDTLPGAENLGAIQDIELLQNMMYNSLRVPKSRFSDQSNVLFGRQAEISREELTFSKFINRLRRRFNELFDDLLKTNLILKGIIKEEDWPEIKENISYKYTQDQYFQEVKEAEMLRNRIDLLNQVQPYVGKYFSIEQVNKQILRYTDEEIEKIAKQIAENPPQQPDGQPGSIQAGALSNSLPGIPSQPVQSQDQDTTQQ